MKPINIPYHRQLVQAVITLMLMVIVITISSGIFADSNYYKEWFMDFVKNSGNLRSRSATLRDGTDN